MMPRAPAPLAAALTASALAAVAACTADARAPLAQVEFADRTPWTDPVYDDVLDVVELTADRIQGDYAAGRYSALELVQAYLARIDTFEQVYNAFVSMNGNARETAVSGPRASYSDLRTTSNRRHAHAPLPRSRPKQFPSFRYPAHVFHTTSDLLPAA